MVAAPLSANPLSAARLSAELGSKVDPAIISSAMEAMLGGAYVSRVPDGALLWYNDGAAEMWGFRPTLPDGEARFLAGLQMFSLAGTPLAAHGHASVALMVPGTVSAADDVLMVRPDGSQVHLQVRTQALRDADDKLVAIFHHMRDVSAGRHTEEALRASEERYRQILQSTRDCIKVLDLEGNLISMNPEGQERLGIPDFSKVQGSSWFDFWLGTDRELARGACESARQGGTGRFEAPYTTASGDVLWWDVSVTPILTAATKDVPGEPTNLLVVSREITTRRLAEDALRQNEKLAAVGRLAASISHEINNPLEAVTNLIYLAQTSSHLEEVHQFLKMADEQVKRVSHIVNQTLRFHRQSTRAQMIDGHEMIDSVLSLYRGRLMNANVSAVCRYRGLAGILCYEGNSRQVLSNLVANAIDSMKAGGRILVRAQRGTDWRSGRSGMKITVADTGHGMDTRTRSRIFQPFYTTKGEHGTGLGLWISKEIVDRDGGVLRLRTRSATRGEAVRSGTVFTFFLPDEPLRHESVEAVAAA